MNKKLTGIFVIISILMFLSYCAKEKVKTEPIKEEPTVEKVEEITPKIEKPLLSEEEIFLKKSLEEINKEGNLSKIHFDFDRYYIKDNMKPVLHRNADWLLKHSSIEIVLEGHCDERGTVEYNIALGEKRAETTKKYIVSLGVSADKIRIISYGKSRLTVKGVNEHTHYLNRRSEFLITKK